MGQVVNQLRPFNKERFDECMAFLSATHRSPLTQYEMVKLHIMTDVFHFLRYGKPVIGGPLSRWPRGPVVRPAYARVRRWGYAWDESGTQPDSFEIVGKRGKAFLFKPNTPADPEAFSRSELDALEQAWQCVMPAKGWGARNRFFHEDDSFIGRAWKVAGSDGEPIDWNAIVDAYHELHPEFQNANHLKALIGF